MSAEDDKKATENVLNVLKDKLIGTIEFSAGGFSIAPAMYEKVSKAIVEEKITVIVWPNGLPAGAAGAYQSTLEVNKDMTFHDVLILKNGEIAGTKAEQLMVMANIVHESTHAICDILETKAINAQNEAVAYIAECIFTIGKMSEMGGHPERVVQPDAYRNIAWSIAGMILEGKKVSIKDWNSLNVAISKSDLYKKQAKEKTENNGVGRAWKLPKAASGGQGTASGA